MFAELLGKEAGYCKGKGGSMHIADPATGNLGANAIVWAAPESPHPEEKRTAAVEERLPPCILILF